MIRLDRYCSSMGIATRSEMAQWCKKWYITVNDQIIKYSDSKIIRWSYITKSDSYGVIEWSIECKEYITLLVYKPAWYVCSDLDEGGHLSYSNLITWCPYWRSLHVAGRLDQDTTWLIVCTNDGQLNHRIISPKHKLTKTYFVACEKPITSDMIQMLQEWVILDDGYKTLPATVHQGIDHEWMKSVFINYFSSYHALNPEDHTITLSIQEGKYHQIKRMMEVVHNKVIALHRYSIGSWTLSWLQVGERMVIDPYYPPI